MALLCAGCVPLEEGVRNLDGPELPQPWAPIVVRPRLPEADPVAVGEPPASEIHGRRSCLEIAAALGTPLADEVQRLCEADRYVGTCVGVACTAPAQRRAFECLTRDVQGDAVWVELSGDDNPVVRTYAREALIRSGRLTPDVVADALQDRAAVPVARGCLGGTMRAWEVGVLAARTFPDRAALQPALRAVWAAVPEPVVGDRALTELIAALGDEAWIADAELERIATHATDAALRGAAERALGADVGGPITVAAAVRELRGSVPAEPLCRRAVSE
ncbi:MAG: hypothetical protein AAF721_22325 [Myxococcota bacterium]